MFFRRKGKKAGGRTAKAGRATDKTAGTKGKTGGASGKAAGRGAGGAAGAQQKGAAPTHAGQKQNRAQAEAQIKQMMSDGSLDKVKTMMKARSPEDVAEEYPDETVSVIRNWLNDPNR